MTLNILYQNRDIAFSHVLFFLLCVTTHMRAMIKVKKKQRLFRVFLEAVVTHLFDWSFIFTYAGECPIHVSHRTLPRRPRYVRAASL